MIKVETQCGCGAEVVVKANEAADELVVQVRTTHQYTERRESLKDRVERLNGKPCSMCGSRDTSGSLLLCAKCRADAQAEIGYEYPDDQNAREHAEYTQSRYTPDDAWRDYKMGN